MRNVRTASANKIRRGGEIGAAEHEFDAKTLLFDEARDAVDLELFNGVRLSIPRCKIEGLANLPKSTAREMRLGPLGAIIEVRSRDIDISVNGVIGKITGLDWASRAGKVRSAAKSAAARANGKLGGRPPMGKAPGGDASEPSKAEAAARARMVGTKSTKGVQKKRVSRNKLARR